LRFLWNLSPSFVPKEVELSFSLSFMPRPDAQAPYAK
jgi:hypothetical protein